MTSLQLSETEEGIKELEYLVNAVEDQEAYISALVWLAQRYRFSIASDEATSIRCPIRNSKRFPILLDFWFYIAIGNVVWCSIYLLRKPPKQYYMMHSAVRNHALEMIGEALTDDALARLPLRVWIDAIGDRSHAGALHFKSHTVREREHQARKHEA